MKDDNVDSSFNHANVAVSWDTTESFKKIYRTDRLRPCLMFWMRAIVHRELLAASRRKATYIFRGFAAAIGIAIAFIVSLIDEEYDQIGRHLFWAIAVAGCVFALREGCHRAAIALSEERAQGTLGLLFLTTLKGFDVVFGKFASVSLLAFQTILALIPVLALTLLFGGVSIAEVFRASAWLANIVFFFIASSLLISAITASEIGAIVLSVAFLGSMVWLGTYEMATNHSIDSLGIRFDPISPGEFVSNWGFRSQGQFWISILLSHITGWIMLLSAGKLLQRTWPKPQVFPKLAVLWTRKPRAARRRGPVRVLGAAGPLEWLTLRHTYERAPLAVVTISTSLSAVYAFANVEEGQFTLAMVSLIILALGVAIHAPLAVAAAHKTGILDLVAVTPISNIEIVAGQIRGLQRAFLIPSIIAIGWMALSLEWNGFYGDWQNMFSWDRIWFITSPQYQLLNVGLMLWASAYVGIWAGLKEKGPVRAIFRTVLLTLVLPWVFPLPTALYLFVVGNIARQTVRTEFREILINRLPKPPPFPVIHKEEIVSPEPVACYSCAR